jgi:hypothetical protein
MDLLKITKKLQSSYAHENGFFFYLSLQKVFNNMSSQGLEGQK